MSASPSRLAGWILAGSASAMLLTGAAALALVADRGTGPVPIALDLSPLPASAPVVAAMADPAPRVVSELDSPPQPVPDADSPPGMLTADTGPNVPQPGAALASPMPETPAVANLDLPPPPPAPMVQPKPEPKPEKKSKAKSETKSKSKTAAEKAEKTAEKTAPAKPAAAGATGAKESKKAKGGAEMSPESYRKAVFKKISRTRQKRGPGKGKVMVQFTVGADGSITAISISQSSGNAKVDDFAVKHVQRAAPFPPPPGGKPTRISAPITVK